MPRNVRLFPRRIQLFPRKVQLFPHKSPPFSRKVRFLLRKVRLFPRQILLSPENSDVFWTVKVAILKCPKPGGFESRFFNIFYFHFQGKLCRPLFYFVFNPFSCSTGRHFWRQPSLSTPQSNSKNRAIHYGARARAQGARRRRGSNPLFRASLGKPV